MTEYKYPYIPKPYYPAVMLACKIIREERAFNKAINSAAKYYGVDKNELEKHVRARQAAGQRGKKRESGYEMKWWLVVRGYGTEAGGINEWSFETVRGKSRTTVERRFLKDDMDYNIRNDMNGSSYSPCVWSSVQGPFDSEEKAAEERHRLLQAERDKQAHSSSLWNECADAVASGMSFAEWLEEKNREITASATETPAAAR